MDNFSVESYFGIHEGGTKFYHVHLFRKTGSSDAVLVTHWGKRNMGLDLERHVPRSDGQFKVERTFGNTLAGFEEATNKKRKRGYSFGKLERNDFSSESKLGGFLAHFFGKGSDGYKSALEILSGGSVIADDVDDSPDTKKKSATAKKEEPRPAEWGTW